MFLRPLFGILALGLSSLAAQEDPLMPRMEDHTQMWWAEGFPKHTPTAPWRRVIETGYFAMALDTEALRIPHFGAGKVWNALPPAELELKITVGGKTYRATSGGEWTRWSGPRLIESGRFFQRADVTDLVFQSEDGDVLETEARFETAAWPDRLGLILAASGEDWKDAELEISLKTEKGTLRQRTKGNEVFLAIDPVAFQSEGKKSPVVVNAFDRPVEFDPARGWHRINLDGIEPEGEGNDALERIKFKLANSTDADQVARLMFEKTARGIRHRIGSPITGVTAVLRDAEGNPIGIPVQLSKNWHNDPQGGVYSGQWFHGLSQIRLPAGCRIDVELVLAYGHWGGVPAASHAQLSLIGWGGNALWEQSALGAWGESICYDPDQAQANCTITDVRPLMVTPMGGKEKWSWTQNMGGGDFFRFFDPDGNRIAHTGMRTTYQKQGPCLTEVTYAGKVGNAITQSATVSLGRTDDIVRGTYRIRLDVGAAVEFSRFAIFQIGADTYNATSERRMAIGNNAGLIKEWDTHWGGNVYRMEPLKLEGRSSWVSLHHAVPRESEKGGAIANRGFVIREWKARLGGKDAPPWIAERGLTLHRNDSSTFDLVPPPGVTRLEAGDFIEATLEHLVMPQSANDYYGPNEALRAALATDGDTWRMIHREAAGNDRRIEMKTGVLASTHPSVTVGTADDQAAFSLTGGLGYVPITFTGLTSPRGYVLTFDGKPVDQSTHGHDFWQTDFDPKTRTWSQTYNLPIHDAERHEIRFELARKP